MQFVGIDPATITGFVRLNEKGEVLEARTIKGEGKKEKGGITIQQLVSLENQFYKLLQPEDEILIEAAAVGTQMAITTGMIHGGLRTMIERKKMGYLDLAPSSVKKYVGVTGWKKEGGKNVRLKGEKEKKDAMAAGALSHFGFANPDHNITDAYIIARICWGLHLFREYLPTIDNYPYQIEVVQGILQRTDTG